MPLLKQFSADEIAENRGAIGDPNVWVLYDMALDHSGTLAASYGVNWETDATDSLLAVGWLYQGDMDNDGHFYGYNDQGQFMRIDADDYANYKILGNANLNYNKYQVTAVAVDYTSGTMYALTLPSNYDYETWMPEERVGKLVTVDLDTGKMTLVAKWIVVEDVPPTGDISVAAVCLALVGLTTMAACMLAFANRKRREQN